MAQMKGGGSGYIPTPAKGKLPARTHGGNQTGVHGKMGVTHPMGPSHLHGAATLGSQKTTSHSGQMPPKPQPGQQDGGRK